MSQSDGSNSTPVSRRLFLAAAPAAAVVVGLRLHHTPTMQQLGVEFEDLWAREIRASGDEYEKATSPKSPRRAAFSRI